MTKTTNENMEVPENLFKSVKYFLIGSISEKVEKMLNQGGGKRDHYLSQMVTHAIAEDVTEDECSEAKELFELPVVTSRWVEMSVKCSTLLPVNAFSPDPAQIFSGVVACPSQLSREDQGWLWAQITMHGGVCQGRLSPSVTHLITAKTTGLKYDCAMRHNSRVHIVTPDWITDCLAEEKKLEEIRYHPRLIVFDKPKSLPVPMETECDSEPVVSPTTPTPMEGMEFGGRLMKPEFSRTTCKEALAKMVSSRLAHSHRSPPDSSQSSRAAHRQLCETPPSGNQVNRPPQSRLVETRPDRDHGSKMAQRRLSETLPEGKHDMRPAPSHMEHTPPVGSRLAHGQIAESPPGGNKQTHGQLSDTPPAANRLPLGQISDTHHVNKFPHAQPSDAISCGNFANRPGRGRPINTSPHDSSYGNRFTQGRVGETPPDTPPALPVPGIPPPPIPMRPPTAIMPTSPRLQRPQLPMGPRISSPRGGRGRGSPRNTLRNITNSGEPRPPKTPKSSRSPGRGNAKINQVMPGMGRGGHAGRGRGAQAKSPVPVAGQMGMYTAPEHPLYYGHDLAENLPPDLCLLGCIFYMTDYQKYLDPAQVDTWCQVVIQHGGQVDESYSNRVTHVLCDSQRSDVFQLALRDGKRVVTAHWLNDVLVQKRVTPPWMALHLPSIYGQEKACANQIICVTNFTGEERVRIKQMINMIGAKYTGYMTHANSVVVARKLEGVKYNKAQEWRIPVVNVAWLSDLLLGDLMALKLPVQSRYRIFTTSDVFTIEQWKVSHLMGGWKMPIKISKEIWKMIPAHKLRALSNQNQPEKRPADSPTSAPPEKRLKIESSCQLQAREGFPIVMITGLTRGRAIQITKIIESMGGVVRSEVATCSHLVAGSIARTVKFLTALSVVKHIVVPEWVEQSARAGQFLNETDFALRDMSVENGFNFSLKESLARAQWKKLFQELQVYITPSVIPDKGTLRSILESAGGRLLDKQPKLRILRSSMTSQGKPSHVVISCENDIHLLLDLQCKGIAVHNAEFILTGVMRQDVDYETFRIS